MEPRREPPCHTLDQPGQERPGRPGQVDCSTVTAAGGSTGCGLAEGNGGVFSFSSSSSLEGGSTNSDSDRGGKRPRRRKRVPRQAAERGGAWAGMQAESVWFDRAVYERAESAYQAWLAGGAPPEPRSRSPQPSDCRHGDQVACHHLVQAVWVNKSAFESAERSFMERTQPSPATPSSLALSPRRGAPAGPSRTPDEGYLSLTPTPATPLAPPAARRSVNGLPGLPAELLTGVWVEKSRYDRAEATYYQSLCRPPATPAHTPTDAPACNGAGPSCVFGVQRGAPEPQQADARPCPAQPGEGAGQDGLLCFLHPDSERAWLEAPRFCAAERHFHERQAAAEARPPDDDPTTPSMPRSDTMTGVEFLAQEKIWFDKFRYDEAECRFYERMNGPTQPAQETGANSILQDIARARENIQKSLSGGVACGAGDQGELVARMKSLELENQNLHKVVEDLRSALCRLESRVALLEKRPAAAPAPAPAPAPACTKTAPIQQPKVRAPVEEDDDDLDLFGSDEEDEEAEKIREERLKAYAEKKAKKPALIAKSSILLDVKPWDDETDMVKLEECVRSVQADGLLWGSSKLVAVGYGIKKLQIQCVVEDDKVGTDMLEEEITKFEDYVQSVDVAAFNKI